MVVLWYDPCSKNGVKFSLWKHSMHCFYGFRTGKTHIYNSCIACVHLVICFRPTVALPDSPCPMSIASREPEIPLANDRRSPSPTQQTYSACNQRISERFFLIIGYVLSLFCVDSLLASEDILCLKLFVAFEGNNSWISNRSYVRTEESVKMERDISYRRTTIVLKRNVNFILAPTVWQFV